MHRGRAFPTASRRCIIFSGGTILPERCQTNRRRLEPRIIFHDIFPMKPILLFVLALACGAMARAEIFTPRVMSGRSGLTDRPARAIDDHRQTFSGNRYGAHFGGFRSWRDHDDFRGFRADWWGPLAMLSFGYDDYLYDGWYGWPRQYRYAGWYDRPVFFEPEIRTAYVPIYRGVSYAASGQSGPMQTRDDIRDARSPDQLRAIYGAQAEQLIRRD